MMTDMSASQQGYLAALQGKFIDDNPHEAGSVASKAWIAGWQYKRSA